MSARAGRAALQMIDGSAGSPAPSAWFCGHCAAAHDAPEAPNARVCGECGLGLVHQTTADAVPGPDDGFAIIDRSLTVQAISHAAENLFGVCESEIVNHHVTTLFLPADAEADGIPSLATVISRAAAGDDSTHRMFVRPATTFGVRLQVRIAACGPPSAALIVLA